MKTTNKLSTLAFLAAAFLSACASGPQQASPSQLTSNTYGVIDSIQVSTVHSGTSGAGAVVGGVVGAVLGNQVGGGNGKTAATVVGAVGGAVVGNNIEANRNAQALDSYKIGVLLDNGERVAVVQESIFDLRVGNRVHVVDGHAYRY